MKILYLPVKMEQLEENIFYLLDKSIRVYRQYAQRRLKKKGFKITIDQWLIIRSILENPDIKQNELGEKVFKDNASVTRIIDLLVKGKYLKRETHNDDKRRTSLKVTPAGKKVIKDVQALVMENRANALKGISKNNIKNMKEQLRAIIKNSMI
jgi:MarR family transcriptional regulator for hemolysin